MKQLFQHKLWLALFSTLLWLSCGAQPKQPGDKNEGKPVLEIIPEKGVSASHRSPIPPGTNVPGVVDRPDDKPDDPSLFVGSLGPWIGDPCTSSSDCSFAGGYCMKDSDGFPQGYCLKTCTKYCPDRSGKPFTFCVKRGNSGACFSRCDTGKYSGTGCRKGYKCKVEPRFNQSSAQRGVCVPDPNGSSQPPSQPPATKWIGEPCTSDQECNYEGGLCLKSGFPSGYCSKACTKYCQDQAGKPGTFCVTLNAKGACTSRCDTNQYPGSGCRAGYTCQTQARYNQTSVTRDVCLPTPSTPTPPQPSTPDGDLTVTPGLDCYAQLTRWGVKFNKTSNPNTLLSGASRRCSVSQPIRLQPPILGVDYVIWNKRRVSMLVSCSLALSIARFSHYLKQRQINKVMHYGTYNCRKISGSSKLSNHSFGSAIDIAGFWGSDGTEYNLVKSWDHSSTWKSGGRMGCFSTRFNSPKAKVLYDIACDMWKKSFFTLVLTPNYNRAHDDHFHVDLSSSGTVLSNLPSGYIGTAGEHKHESMRESP